jgi:hypothetical protein
MSHPISTASERHTSRTARNEHPPTRCSRSPVPASNPRVRAIAFPRGIWPVYVGLGTGGVIHYTSDRVHHGGWWYYKTLWAVAPDYTGPVVITGHQINGPRLLRFNASGPIDQVPSRPPPLSAREPHATR